MGNLVQMPYLLVNGSGSSMMANTYWRSLASFSAYLQQQQSSYTLNSSYLSAGSGVGRSDFFNAFGLFGATDSDVAAADLKYFLPDDGTGYSNVTKYIDPRAPQHLGSLLLPVLGGALAIVHNVPGIPDSNPLVLNSTVLGDMFCGAISWWNDTAIQQLNPTLSLPTAQIKLIGRGDSSGSTQVFTSYLSAHSSKFKSKIGVSSLPKWPSSVILGNTASELIYVSSNVKYSLTYAPMEAVMQAKSLGQNPQIVGIYNSKQIISFPSVNSTITAMQAAALQAPFSRHNYLNIYDIDDANAYPIALMSFLLIRENYYYFTPGSQYECDRIKAMIYFWYFLMTDQLLIETNFVNGWVPMTGDLLNDNMRALGFVTCNRRNIMDDLNTDFQRKQFYSKREKQYNWDFAITFWSNTLRFETTRIGSTLYLIFYVSLFLSNAIPFGVNMVRYYQKGEDDHSNSQTVRASAGIRTGSVYVQSLAIEKDDDTDNDDTSEKDAKIAGKIKFTTQNQLAILTQFITCFQILYLCMNRSIVIQENIYVDIISYLGLIPDWADSDEEEVLEQPNMALMAESHMVSLAGQAEPSILPGNAQDKSQPAALNSKLNGSGGNIKGSGSLSNLSTGQFSLSQWKQFDSMILLAKKIDILSKDEYKYVKMAIRLEDPIIPIMFSRSGKNLNRFVDQLKLKVYQVLLQSAQTPSGFVPKYVNHIASSQVRASGINGIPQAHQHHQQPQVSVGAAADINRSSQNRGSQNSTTRVSQRRRSRTPSRDKQDSAHLHAIKRTSLVPGDSRDSTREKLKIAAVTVLIGNQPLAASITRPSNASSTLSQSLSVPSTQEPNLLQVEFGKKGPSAHTLDVIGETQDVSHLQKEEEK
ncbi:UNVERIFIED_CONTAM: hypothetical protein HDU68_011605 [Siphonaria sp. JEL0065]|nr:hypothetical protein HDU68_011605 [Siphonaria sp. JEL0065]